MWPKIIKETRQNFSLPPHKSQFGTRQFTIPFFTPEMNSTLGNKQINEIHEPLTKPKKKKVERNAKYLF